MTMQGIDPMRVLLGTVARNWWLILVRGLAAMAFGIVCFVWPAISLLALGIPGTAYFFRGGIE